MYGQKIGTVISPPLTEGLRFLAGILRGPSCRKQIVSNAFALCTHKTMAHFVHAKQESAVICNTFVCFYKQHPKGNISAKMVRNVGFRLVCRTLQLLSTMKLPRARKLFFFAHAHCFVIRRGGASGLSLFC